MAKLIQRLTRFNSLESRIVVFFVALLILVQLAVFFAIQAAIERVAHDKVQEELQVGQRVFKQLLDQNGQQLVEATSVLTFDFGFREAIATNDRDTILSALRNHASRIKADGMTLIGLDNVVVADTLDGVNAGRPFAYPELIAEAQRTRRASTIRLINGKAYQIVVVPVLAPVPISWVSMAFVIDDGLARVLQRITGLDVSFVGVRKGDAPRTLASTLGSYLQNRLLSDPAVYVNRPTSFSKPAANDVYELLSTELVRVNTGGGETAVYAVLQRAMSDLMAPYGELTRILLFLSAISLAITLIGALRIARRITKPVTELANAAKLMTKGEYIHTIKTKTGDEIGELATAFNTMAKGMAERDTVRDILGKVASPAVAQQLMKQEIELGGEEREVTVLFADIRNFTALCENLSPTKSLALLNRYLTEINEAIEQYEGVIDKYTGDGVMALFGAPVGKPDDAERAVRAGLAICERIRLLGLQLESEGLPNPDIGIGINTARVIAGNIGSPSRLNYTVLGDGVNLAARLESLTKRYQVPIVVGEATFEKVPNMVYRELDKVKVKGRSVSVRIFQPLGREEEVNWGTLAELEHFHSAIEAYRNMEWNEAVPLFSTLQSLPDYRRLCELYLGYLRELKVNPPAEDWDGSFTLYEK
jgi:adenylate cyclase